MTQKVDLTDWEKRELSVVEVAQLFSISRVSVWRWVRKGLLPAPRSYGPQTRRWSGAELAKLKSQAA